MLELQKKYHEKRMERDKELYERQIKIVDAQIDRLVYDFYGLTEEEVKVVEKREDGSWCSEAICWSCGCKSHHCNSQFGSVVISDSRWG